MSDVELVDENHPQADENRFKNSEEAMVFLKEAARSKANLKNFQAAWDRISPKRKTGSEHQERTRMFKGLADQLLGGRLRVRVQKSAVGGVTNFAEAEAGPREKQTWSGGPQLKVRERPDPAPPPPPEPPMNVSQQVEALKSAAESGAPFCERCQDQQQ